MVEQKLVESDKENLEGTASALAVPQPQSSLLNMFPQKLRKKIVDEILKEPCERATDIWYKDEATGCVWVMRHTMHWNLNAMASTLWLNLANDVPEKIVKKVCDDNPDIDTEEIRTHFAEFILHAYNNSLINFCSKEP